MIPSVTNGAIIGSAASKKHEKLPRGSLATMIVLPRTTESSRGTSRSCLLMTARMVPIFPGAFQKCMQGTTGPAISEVVQRKHNYTARQPQ